MLYPADLAGLCCGQPFESKGLADAADLKSFSESYSKPLDHEGMRENELVSQMQDQMESTLAELDAFAHDLHAYFVTGARVSAGGEGKVLLRVPSGFMRNRTQDRIEALAAERKLQAISLALVEEGIAIGRQMMEEMLKNQEAAKGAVQAGSAMPVDVTHAAVLEERRPPINEVGSPSALQARRAGPHPELDVRPGASPV